MVAIRKQKSIQMCKCIRGATKQRYLRQDSMMAGTWRSNRECSRFFIDSLTCIGIRLIHRRPPPRFKQEPRNRGGHHTFIYDRLGKEVVLGWKRTCLGTIRPLDLIPPARHHQPTPPFPTSSSSPPSPNKDMNHESTNKRKITNLAHKSAISDRN